MKAKVVNAVINRVIQDEMFARDIMSRREEALRQYDLDPTDAQAIVVALEEDSGSTSVRTEFVSLLALARFEPLFAAASGSSTKSG